MNSRRFREALNEAFREELSAALMERFGCYPPADARLDVIGMPGKPFSSPGYTDEQCRFVEGFAQGFFRSYLTSVRLAASVKALLPPGEEGNGGADWG